MKGFRFVAKKGIKKGKSRLIYLFKNLNMYLFATIIIYLVVHPFVIYHLEKRIFPFVIYLYFAFFYYKNPLLAINS